MGRNGTDGPSPLALGFLLVGLNVIALLAVFEPLATIRWGYTLEWGAATSGVVQPGDLRVVGFHWLGVAVFVAEGVILTARLVARW